jgi:hypothetical protein
MRWGAVQTLPYQLTGKSAVKLDTRAWADVEFDPANGRETQTWSNMSNSWFRPEIEACLLLLITVSPLKQTVTMLNRPPRVPLTGIETSSSHWLSSYATHFHIYLVSGNSDTQHCAATLTLFWQELVWLFRRFPFERNLGRWNLIVAESVTNTSCVVLWLVVDGTTMRNHYLDSEVRMRSVNVSHMFTCFLWHPKKRIEIGFLVLLNSDSSDRFSGFIYSVHRHIHFFWLLIKWGNK